MSLALAERDVMTEQLVDAQPEIKLVNITNPLWFNIGITLAIKDFSNKINIPSISHETLYTYFRNTSQFGVVNGRPMAEFWVAFQNENPVSFAHWYVKGLPHSGIVSCDFIYSWNRMREPISLLIDKYLEFGVKNNAPLYEGDAINETIFRVFRKAAFKKGLNLTKTELVNFVGRKR